MSQFWICLFERTLDPGERFRFAPAHHGIWLRSGQLALADRTILAGDGLYTFGATATADTEVDLLHFAVLPRVSAGAETALLAEPFGWDDGAAVLRLDQVSFPPGACAYRHTHPGPGIRCLTEGALEIRSDHHTETKSPMDAWYEGAESPVQATAGPVSTAFVRAMVLPPAYFGQPTLRLLDPADANKPRLQTNRRFFDQRIDLRAG